jgi:predicted RNA-binding Zn-ribbon protein involved in translation (DUF1610 family)
MDDLISRQAVIDAFAKELSAEHNHREMAVSFLGAKRIIEAVPSAQPEVKPEGEWIRNDNGTYSCSVCQSWIPEEQHYYARYCLYCGARMKGEPMSDLIDRQAAIDAIESCEPGEESFMIMSLPSVQTEIIRCKDCKHRDPEDKKCDCGHDIMWQLPRRDDWFCADAERRTDE